VTEVRIGMSLSSPRALFIFFGSNGAPAGSGGTAFNLNRPNLAQYSVKYNEIVAIFLFAALNQVRAVTRRRIFSK
jgi:hypothetical protein